MQYPHRVHLTYSLCGVPSSVRDDNVEFVEHTYTVARTKPGKHMFNRRRSSEEDASEYVFDALEIE